MRNQNFTPVTIYLYRPGTNDRLGMVEGNSTQTYTFDWPSIDVRILIDFLAAGCVLTQELPLVQGDVLLLTIRAADDRRASRNACR